MHSTVLLPRGLANAVTRSSGMRNAASPLYIRDDKRLAGNSERDGVIKGNNGKSWFAKCLREQWDAKTKQRWPNSALVTSLWSLPGNLVGRKQTPAKSFREFHFWGRKPPHFGVFLCLPRSLKKEKHVKHGTYKKSGWFFFLNRIWVLNRYF